MSADTLRQILAIPGLADAVAHATRVKAILDGMRPEDRGAMEPVVRRMVRVGEFGGVDEKPGA